jgi:hypothetical protein
MEKMSSVGKFHDALLPRVSPAEHRATHRAFVWFADCSPAVGTNAAIEK